MKTPVEMQLKILDKMRENVERGKELFESIEYFSTQKWLGNSSLTRDDFEHYEFRVKPQTITINGVEIPKPLSFDELKDGVRYYHVGASTHEKEDAEHTRERGIVFYYTCPSQALEASKLLFGITG